MLAHALISPSVRLCLLLRLGARASRRSSWLWRNLLIGMHGSEVQPGAIFAPGLRLPVPLGVAVAANVKTEPGVTLEHRTNFALLSESGRLPPRRTQVGAGAVVCTGSTVMGGVSIGERAVVAPGSTVTHSIKADGQSRALARH